jgi:hypothetical protein
MFFGDNRVSLSNACRISMHFHLICTVGAHIGSNLPGATVMKPGSCTLPCYGIEFAVLDPTVRNNKS